MCAQQNNSGYKSMLSQGKVAISPEGWNCVFNENASIRSGQLKRATSVRIAIAWELNCTGIKQKIYVGMGVGMGVGTGGV